MTDPSSLIPPTYDRFLQDLKTRIRTAQIRAALSVNRELTLLYWDIGQEILTRQAEAGWGAKVIDRLSKDLKREFPDIKGFSRSNLMYMRAFAEAYPDPAIVQAVLGQITWYHNIALLEKTKKPEERLWYAQETATNGWSRNVLVLQIESELFQRQGSAITNFDRALPQPQSDLAKQLVKDPYCFEFLDMSYQSEERELERGLIDHIRDFLLELGMGFAFMGSQYPLTVSDKEYRLDLLFYHTHLHCYVVIDLKMGEFEPEYSGKMNFYVTAVDNILRRAGDQPTIGLIICKSKDRTIVEYALNAMQKPIGVSTFQLKTQLPEPLQGNLPTIEQLTTEVAAVVAKGEGQGPKPANRYGPET
jgi:predicted nuclease of restriction endonuclease-like (RecB) superfamily